MENINEQNLMNDLLEGNIDNFSDKDKKNLVKMLEDENTNTYMKGLLEGLLFFEVPPTPEEFLDPANGWLTKNTVADTRKWVKDAFIEILSNGVKYNVVCLYGATRLGKSTLLRLLVFYTQVYVNCLKNVNSHFDIGSDTNLTQYMMSFNLSKGKELLVEPIYQLMQKSPRVHRVKMKDQMLKKQKEVPNGDFVFTKASETGMITNRNNFNLGLGNKSPLAIIGADIIQAYIVEIAFFIEDSGASEEEIFRLYSDNLSRIRATVGAKSPLSFVLLDSSANHANSLIEREILDVLSKQDDVFYMRLSQYDVPEIAIKSFPIWYADNSKTFKVCIGNGNFPAQIINNEKELEGIPTHLIIDVPIDAKPEFKRNLIKSIKDIAGYPSSDENTLIQDVTLINDMFKDEMSSIEGIITADSKDEPKKLIWNQIYQKFFITTGINKLSIQRAPTAPRYIGLDFAYASKGKGDIAGVSCVHVERDFENETDMIVVDFSFTVGPGINETNLQAFEDFVIDLVEIGNLPIKKVTADTFQSKPFEQNLKRHGILAEKLSVDTSLNPYLALVTQLFNRTIVAGRNIFLKNNLSCLIRKRQSNGKEKIDHPDGAMVQVYDGGWTTSQAGSNAKDVSDSLASAVYALLQDDLLPTVDYRKENLKFFKNEGQDGEDELIKDAILELRKYGY